MSGVLLLAMGSLNQKQENILVQAQQHIAMQVVDLNLLGGGNGNHGKWQYCLINYGDDEEYVEILEDMRDDAAKFGTLVNVVIPRHDQHGEHILRVGKEKLLCLQLHFLCS
ncbi:hypothetical protein L3X38_021280 [Prunus dulcis]|uniref:Uncharacterized protein n=1 Tax=Prunus dulcis TaxID=3755 RepID=A0AAD4VTR2_PRUDU|nr:hypothetical protein L3X38_021280 [Prunus dulcis]